jgi:hypothetical protein
MNMEQSSSIPNFFKTRKATSNFLRNQGINTSGDLAKCSNIEFDQIVERANPQLGPWLHLTRKEVTDKLVKTVYNFEVDENVDIIEAQVVVAKCIGDLEKDFERILDVLLFKYKGQYLSKLNI